MRPGLGGGCRRRICLTVLCLVPWGLLPLTNAQAGVFDEFEVHGTDIAAPREFTSDLFISYGVRGIRAPGYHGALVTDRATYLTPLLGRGMTEWWEAAILLPTAIDQSGQFTAGGARFHNVLVMPHAPGDGWTFGAVLEVSALSRAFSPAVWAWEIRPLAMFEHGRLTTRLTLGLIGGFSAPNADVVLAPSFGLYWDVTPGVRLGLEHFAELGRVLHPQSPNAQSHQTFLTTRFGLGPFGLELGLGHGLTPVTEPWVGKLRLSYDF